MNKSRVYSSDFHKNNWKFLTKHPSNHRWVDFNNSICIEDRLVFNDIDQKKINSLCSEVSVRCGNIYCLPYDEESRIKLNKIILETQVKLALRKLNHA